MFTPRLTIMSKEEAYLIDQEIWEIDEQGGNFKSGKYGKSVFELVFLVREKNGGTI